LTLESIFY